MLSTQEKQRYSRHLLLPEIGLNGQEKLKKARVLVIGAGGLGCPVLLYLAAAGIGTIGIIDNDSVDESNLQRQIIYSVKDKGRSKTLAAKEKIEALNPYIVCNAYEQRLNKDNALHIIDAYDIVVDGSDNFQTRYLVNDACIMCNKPLVFASIFKFEGQLSVFNYKEGPTYRCLYPQPPAPGEMPSCSEIGVIGVLPGILGTLQANEVIKIVTGVGEVCSGKLLLVDALSLQFISLDLKTVSANKNINRFEDYDALCNAPTFNSTTVREMSHQQLQEKLSKKESVFLVDVREVNEYKTHNIGGLLIPLNTLRTNVALIPRDQEVVIHCQSGTRSQKAIQLLQEEFGYTNLYNLTGGLTNALVQ